MLRLHVMAASLYFGFPALAHAAAFQVTLHDASNTASFTLPDMPVPSSFVEGNHFEIASVPTLLNGVVVNDDWYFLSSSSGGGIADSLNIFNLPGPQYFSGPVSSPTLLQEALTDQFNYITGNGDVTVDIGPVVTTLRITVSGPSHTASFEAPLGPHPDSYVTGNHFALSVPTVLDGIVVTDTWYFLPSASGGGLADSLNLFNLLGPQYYFGTEASPTFVLGAYPGAFNYVTGDSDNTVTITVTTVPEPATISVASIGLLGLVAARRKRVRPTPDGRQ